MLQAAKADTEKGGSEGDDPDAYLAPAFKVRAGPCCAALLAVCCSGQG